MAGFSILYIPDDAKVRRLFADLDNHVRDLTPLLNVLCERMDRSTKMTFAAEGRPVKWKPSRRVERAGEISATKRRVGGPLKTLRLTGLLELSTHWVPTGPNEVRGGTVENYGRIHQLGGRIEGTANVGMYIRTITEAFGKPLKDGPTQVLVGAHQRHMNTTIPARPFLVVQPDDEAYFARKIVAYLKGAGA
jgi:phage gpG-like protein